MRTRRRTRTRIATVGAGALLALLPTLARADTAYPDPQEITGQEIIHDPTLMRLKNGKYVAYSTGGIIGARLSDDRKHWQDAGNAFAAPPAWWKDYSATSDPWAPDLIRRDGTYWLYYAVSSWGTNHSAIGVATSASGMPGTWEDRGKVFSSEKTDPYNAIDASVIKADGKLWMAFGSYWSGIRIVELDPDTGKARPGAQIGHLATRPDLPYAVEGPEIVRHGRYYYLFASYDACCAGTDSTYRIRVGRSASVTGPYKDSTGKPMLEGGGDLLLAGHGTFIGPGGQSVLSEGGRDTLAYHYYDATDSGTPKLGLNEISWGADGWPDVR
ncbi:arabinan endo-1,5-alpha-L-arabinosidase [Streptomyces sp. TRM66268-LWL]|uniref:Arabinan endo-1,5-alpha-L-arabinosidase n=1 Tax=Streptomyces polyasparticus TaxID=2767826 RepID=A0ABR7SGM9_9ACTN|nr:arabinan endo-1,5-alpha-L-arabinosidase [Streptomyces polyasparticus]